MQTQTKSDFVKHIACEHCGSSDANALYTDGHSHCFACGTTQQGEAVYEQPKVAKVVSLIEGTVQAIADRGISRATCETYGVEQDNGRHLYPYFDASGNKVARR